MDVVFAAMKRGQWRSNTYSSPASRHNEFKAKVYGETIEGFTKHKANGTMKVYEDANGDGILNKGDDLIAKGKVDKGYRGDKNPLGPFEVGSVKQTWETVEFDQPAGLGYRPVMEFRNRDGDMVANLGLDVRPLMPILDEGFGLA